MRLASECSIHSMANFYDFLLRFRCLSFVRPVILPTNYKCRVLWNRFCKCDPNRRKKNNWATKNAIIVRFESSLWTELVLDESFCLQPISWALRFLSRFYCIASISWIKCMRWFTIKTNRMWNILHWKRPFPLANPESCVYYVAFLLFCVDGNNFKVAITYVNGWALCEWQRHLMANASGFSAHT